MHVQVVLITLLSPWSLSHFWSHVILWKSRELPLLGRQIPFNVRKLPLAKEKSSGALQHPAKQDVNLSGWWPWEKRDNLVSMRFLGTAEWCLWSKDFQILCVLQGRIHLRTYGCKWSLLNVKEDKYKREHGGVQMESGGRFLFQMLLKPVLNYGNVRPSWFPSSSQWVSCCMDHSPYKWGWSLNQSLVHLKWNTKFLWVPNFP
jgi:hypothetical protein